MTNWVRVMAACVWGLLLSAGVAAQDKADPLRMALVQAHLAWGDVEKNLSAFGERVDRCTDCDVIVFPELFVSGCEMKKKPAAVAVASKDEVAASYAAVRAAMLEWAARTGALVIGSTVYQEEGKYYNRLLAAYPDGTCLHYDKHNCFKKGSFSAGKERLVLHWKGWRLATFICYDLRFSDWSRNDGTYDMALYIANWPETRRDDWNRLLKERAVENRAWVAAVNCAGTDPTGLVYRGESCLLTPTGDVAARSRDYADEIVRATARDE